MKDIRGFKIQNECVCVNVCIVASMHVYEKRQRERDVLIERELWPQFGERGTGAKVNARR